MNDVAKDRPTQLFLIRHGATDANLRRPPILQGCGIDLPLNETGLKQAQRLAEFLSPFPISHIYCSPLRRAAETAAVISQPLGLSVSTRAELTECNVGRWEGLDWGTIRRDFPDAVRAFDEDSGECPYLGGESYGDVLRRARPLLDSLLLEHSGESIVVVAHNVVTRVYAAYLLGLDLKRA
ncbi:MAG: histidine phosphatase family protein, partial [Planctomycetaceae bacterium]